MNNIHEDNMISHWYSQHILIELAICKYTYTEPESIYWSRILLTCTTISIILTTSSMFNIYNVDKANNFCFNPRSNRTYASKITVYLHATVEKNIDKCVNTLKHGQSSNPQSKSRN